MTIDDKTTEIGSEFWDIPVSAVSNNLFPPLIQWYLSGRTALQAIIEEVNHVKTVAIPSWCCHTIIKPFIDVGIKVFFYPVYFDKTLIQKLRFDCDALLLMDYFGYSHHEIANLSQYQGVIIRDITHSIFSKSYSDADYYFGSLRKWCGFWTGGYAWMKDGYKLASSKYGNDEYIKNRKKAMELKNCYVNKVPDAEEHYVKDKHYLKLFKQAESFLDNNNKEIISASMRDIQLAHKLDIKSITDKRRANAKILMDAFPACLMFNELESNDVLLFVPILVPQGKREQLRQYLIQHEIYCPVHWPISEYHKLDKQTEFIYKNELSLICDQRYTEDDMKRIVKTINDFMKVA